MKMNSDYPFTWPGRRCGGLDLLLIWAGITVPLINPSERITRSQALPTTHIFRINSSRAVFTVDEIMLISDHAGRGAFFHRMLCGRAYCAGRRAAPNKYS